MNELFETYGQAIMSAIAAGSIILIVWGFLVIVDVGGNTVMGPLAEYIIKSISHILP